MFSQSIFNILLLFRNYCCQCQVKISVLRKNANNHSIRIFAPMKIWQRLTFDLFSHNICLEIIWKFRRYESTLECGVISSVWKSTYQSRVIPSNMGHIYFIFLNHVVDLYQLKVILHCS